MHSQQNVQSRKSLSYHLEVELFAVEVGAYYTYSHRVTNGELASMATTNDAVVGIVELIVVVLQSTHRHHSLTLILVYFGIEAPLGHTTDNSVELLANVLAHELNLLVLDTCTLGLRGDNLTLGRVHAERLQLLLIATLLASEV